MRSIHYLLQTAAFVLISGGLFRASGADASELNRIIDGMIRRQEAQLEAIASYTRIQSYSVTSARFGARATREVRIHSDRIKGKSYEIISRSGSTVIQNRVIDGLLDAEIRSSLGAELLTRANYSFRLLGQEDPGGGNCYVLETIPTHKDTRLLKGRIWVDTEDFSVMRVEGRSSESPSFWVGKPVIVRDYTRIEGYSWATRAHSHVENLLLGKSELVIEYSDYQFEFKHPQGLPTPQAKPGAVPLKK